jgi:hypothetical protein
MSGMIFSIALIIIYYTLVDLIYFNDILAVDYKIRKTDCELLFQSY